MARRQFLIAAGAGCAATSFLSACGQSGMRINPALPEKLSDKQLARKRQGRSAVGVIKCPSYEDDLFLAVKPFIKDLGLPDLKNKVVVVKPNMVEFHPNHPITTNPASVLAAVQLADYLGAKEIIVGEGPGHMRDSEFLLEASGIGKLCRQHKLRFVDLNLDDLEKVANPDNLSGINEFYLPATIVSADAVISAPKMKTHHWVGVTASMKNMFGTVPGRKYGWPKNFLHIRGIPQCILDLVCLVKPCMGFVDGVVAMEGDGPINGTAKEMGVIVLGTDLAAVDATCARAMGAPFDSLEYLQVAGRMIGNIDPAMIDIVGAPVDSIKQQFAFPITYQDKKLLALSGRQAS